MAESKKGKRSQDNAAKNEKTAVAVKDKKNSNLNTVDAKKGEVKKVEKKNNNKVEAKTSPLDKLLWLFAFALLALAIGGNYYYTRYMVFDESSLERLGRVAVVIITIAAALATILFTIRGKKLLAFGRESYVELRKVVWPTRQEAIQTTFIVFIAVSVVSLFLYLCDLVFLQIVRVITL